MAKNPEKVSNVDLETSVATPPDSFPCPVEEYCSSKKLNSFDTKVFVKAMHVETGNQTKLMYDEWDAKRNEFYSRPVS